MPRIAALVSLVLAGCASARPALSLAPAVASVEWQPGDANGKLTGVIFDATTHAPVADAVIIVTSRASGTEKTDVSDVEGRFSIDVGSGDSLLEVYRDGFEAFRVELKRPCADPGCKVRIALVPDRSEDSVWGCCFGCGLRTDSVWTGRIFTTDEIRLVPY